MISHRIRINTVDYTVLKDHLDSCSELFEPPLRSYVDIMAYTIKIIEKATTVEYWIKKCLAGVIAVYYNDPDKAIGFITNISVIRENQGKGVASKLLKRVIRIGKNSGFSSIRLEVRASNEKAIYLYRKHGFVDLEKREEVICMEKIL